MTDKQLLKLAKSFRKGILGKDSPKLMCITISMPLEAFLNSLGVSCRMVIGGLYGVWCNHAWLELSDGRILDATADQFNDHKCQMPEIYIGIRPDHYLDDQWNPGDE